MCSQFLPVGVTYYGSNVRKIVSRVYSLPLNKRSKKTQYLGFCKVPYVRIMIVVLNTPTNTDKWCVDNRMITVENPFLTRNKLNVNRFSTNKVYTWVTYEEKDRNWITSSFDEKSHSMKFWSST